MTAHVNGIVISVTHRQGDFIDPFGHIWFVGDTSPFQPHRSAQ